MDQLLRARIISNLSSKLPARKLVGLVSDDLRRMIPRIERQDGLLAPAIDEPIPLAELLVDVYGTELLRRKEVRNALLEQASDEDLMALKNHAQIASRGRAAIVTGLASRTWHPGKHWPRIFVQVLGLPAELAGAPDGGSRNATEVVEPPVPLNPLHDFQATLKDRIRTELLPAGPKRNRAILSLPTGAGKTRTAVEALVEHLREEKNESSVVWIAQSEELCEQAVEAFREVWMDQSVRDAHRETAPRVRPLNIYRFWGRYAVPDIEPGSVVVAGIQKLGQLDPAKRRALLEEFSVAVIDEAHHAIAPTYTKVFEDFMLEGSNRPVLGLTATPYRGNPAEFHRLIQRFYRNLMTPDFEDPIEELRNRGVLASIEAERVDTRRTFTMDTEARKHFETFGDISSRMLAHIGKDPRRNRMVCNRLLTIEPGRPTLVFACSVEHARLLALLLRRAGRSAAAITEDTPRSLRRLWIQEFRSGDIQFLCNVGVLATGFDAPKIEIVAIARPTASVLVYEQMVGRGMRGPSNGGTHQCLLVDFVDVIEGFGGLMSYTRYEQDWRTDARVMLQSIGP